MITFAAIQTNYVPATETRGASIIAIDGNNTRSAAVHPDTRLGLVDQHRQALVAFLGDLADSASVYTPGYLNGGYVWVRPVLDRP